MNQIILSILLLFVVATNALAAREGVSDIEGTVHVGFKLGPTNIKHQPTGFSMYGGYTILGSNSADKENAFYSKLSVSLEGEYTNLTISSVSVDRIYNAYSFGMTGVVTYPFNSKVSANAKAGVSNVQHTVDCGQVNCKSTSAVGLHVGASGLYKISRMTSISAGFDVYPDNLNMLSVGILYKY